MEIIKTSMVLILLCFFMFSACSDSEDGEEVNGVFVPDSFDFSSFDPMKPCEYEGLRVCPSFAGRCNCYHYYCENGRWKMARIVSRIAEDPCKSFYNCHFYGYDPTTIDGDEDCGHLSLLTSQSSKDKS